MSAELFDTRKLAKGTPCHDCEEVYGQAGETDYEVYCGRDDGWVPLCDGCMEERVDWANNAEYDNYESDCGTSMFNQDWS